MKHLLLPILSISILLTSACADKTPVSTIAENEIIGTYSVQVAPIDTAAIDPTMMAELINGLDIDYIFEKDGKLTLSTTVDGEPQQVPMNWKLMPGDTMCMYSEALTGSEEMIDKFKITKTENGYSLSSTEVTFSLEKQ